MPDVLTLSKYTGLLATALLSANLLLGMFIATRYKQTKWWHRMPLFLKKTGLFRIHNLTAYVGLLLALLHPFLLLFESGHRYQWLTLIFPIDAPAQPWINALGSAALLLLVAVVITSVKTVRRQFAFRTWKAIHLAAYGAAVLFLIHGLLINTQLKETTVDLFDAERMVSLGCFAGLMVAAFLRLRYWFKRKKLSKR